MSFARIDLPAIAANVRQFRRLLPATTLFGAVVKADGYGHGAVPVARAALDAGADWLMVATVHEGIALRAAGLVARVLVLSPTDPREAATLVRHGLTPLIAHRAQADALAQAARDAGLPPPRVHVKVDTGLGRYGIAAADAVPFMRALAACDGIVVEGIATHFATADQPDDPFMHVQAARFAAVLAALTRVGLRPPLAHAANSGATMQRIAPWDMVRVGIALYGITPDPATPQPFPLTPALGIESAIARVFSVAPGESVGYGRTFTATEPTRAALIPLGYADGLMRALSNRGGVLIAGQWCRLIGRISMDQCVAALPPALPAAVGDAVVVVGQSGTATQTLAQLADAAGTIPYELAVGFGARLQRQLIGARAVRGDSGPVFLSPGPFPPREGAGA